MEWWTPGVPDDWFLALCGGLVFVFFKSVLFEFRLHKAGIGVLENRPRVPSCLSVGDSRWA